MNVALLVCDVRDSDVILYIIDDLSVRLCTCECVCLFQIGS